MHRSGDSFARLVRRAVCPWWLNCEIRRLIMTEILPKINSHWDLFTCEIEICLSPKVLETGSVFYRNNGRHLSPCWPNRSTCLSTNCWQPVRVWPSRRVSLAGHWSANPPGMWNHSVWSTLQTNCTQVHKSCTSLQCQDREFKLCSSQQDERFVTVATPANSGRWMNDIAGHRYPLLKTNCQIITLFSVDQGLFKNPFKVGTLQLKYQIGTEQWDPSSTESTFQKSRSAVFTVDCSRKNSSLLDWDKVSSVFTPIPSARVNGKSQWPINISRDSACRFRF